MPIQEHQTIFRLIDIYSKRSTLSTSQRLSARSKERQMERESEPARLQSLDTTTPKQNCNSITLSTPPVCTAIYSPSAQPTTSDSKRGLHLAKGSGYFTRKQ